MKISELLKRQPRPKPVRLVMEGEMGPLCRPEWSNIIHSHHSFESPLSNYCQRCGRTAKGGRFLQPPDTSTKAEDAGCSSPAPATEPTSPTSTSATAHAQDSEKGCASTSKPFQQYFDL